MFKNAYAEFGVHCDEGDLDHADLEEQLIDAGFIYDDRSDNSDSESSDDLGLPRLANAANDRARGHRFSGNTRRGSYHRGRVDRGTFRGNRRNGEFGSSRGGEEQRRGRFRGNRGFRGGRYRGRGESRGRNESHHLATADSDGHELRGRNAPRRRGGSRVQHQVQHQPQMAATTATEEDSRENNGHRETREEFIERMVNEAPAILARKRQRRRPEDFDDASW